MLEGDAGIGKTTLFLAGVSSALERGYRILSCRPASSEVQMSYAALRDLVERLPPEALETLPGPQRRGLEIALRLREAETDALDPATIGIGLLNVLRGLARSGPVVVAIDDLHWIDLPTAAALDFAIRRLDHEPVMLLVAFRREVSRELPLDLERTVSAGQLARLRVGPLSLNALHRLIRLRLGRTFPRSDLVRLREASAGNPFYALELAQMLARRGAHVRDPIPVPEGLERLVERRLAALPPPVHRVLEASAALAEPTVAAVAQATIGDDEIFAVLEAATRAGVIEVEGEHIRFTHPLLAMSAYSQLAPASRRALHQQLASVVTDPERRARHLALAASGPREEAAAAAEEAARHAASRGAPGTAAELSELSVRLTPARRRDLVCRRKLTAAQLHLASGDARRAGVLLEELRGELPPGPERADVLRLLAGLSVFDKQAQLTLLGQAASEAAGDDARLARIHYGLATCWVTRGNGQRALENYRKAVALAEAAGEHAWIAVAIAGLVLAEAATGHPSSALLERALALESTIDGPLPGHSPRAAQALVWLHRGRLDEARALIETLVAEARAVGHEEGIMNGLCVLAEVECSSGSWAAAHRHAVEASELMFQIVGEEHPWVLRAKALVDAHLGYAEDVRSTVERGAAIAERAELFHDRIEHLAVLGFLELSRGEVQRADRIFGPLLAELDTSGWAIAAYFPSGDPIEALIGVGDLERARELIVRLQREAEALESPWLEATGERCRGLLASAEGDPDRAIAAFQRALAAQEVNGWPFERARTLLALGRTQRRAKRKRVARESLQAALAHFEALGARLWAEQARSELARISGRAPASGALTPSEERVAALVARGHTNLETATALHLSRHTVEGHLSRVYAKLGIRSRTELAHRFAGGTLSPRDS